MKNKMSLFGELQRMPMVIEEFQRLRKETLGIEVTCCDTHSCVVVVNPVL
jgi:hypothetical protein